MITSVSDLTLLKGESELPSDCVESLARSYFGNVLFGHIVEHCLEKFDKNDISKSFYVAPATI